MSDKSVLDSLLEFDISPIESKVYLYLLNKEPQSILEISRALHLPRTSIYDAALKLLEKGLVQKHILFKTQKFESFPISILQTLIDKEKAKVDELQKQYTFLKKNISQALLPSTNTQVRYYHGKQGFMQMMWNTLSAEKEIVGYSVFGRIEVVGEKFINRFNEEIQEKGIIDRIIANDSLNIKSFLSNPDEEKRRMYQQTRFISSDRLYISGDTTIYNNIFAVSYWQHGEIVGVEIENAELVKTQKSIFEEMWKIAK